MVEAYERLLVDERAYNVCMSKHIENNVLVPYYISFSFWYKLNLVSCKMYLNKDQKTFKVVSGTMVLFKKISLDNLFNELNRYDYVLGNGKAVFNKASIYADSLTGLYVMSMQKKKKKK